MADKNTIVSTVFDPHRPDWKVLALHRPKPSLNGVPWSETRLESLGNGSWRLIDIYKTIPAVIKTAENFGTVWA